ncbi:MAG TPA: acyl-CoA dehydrogenase, partial [bacterium]|nr:acyl-CoA dehydrogenase [bacterium]
MLREGFFQDGPELGNQYDGDPVLRGYLKRILPPGVLEEVEPDLRRMGGRTVMDILALGREAEAHPPQLISRDPWGRLLSHIEVSRAWQDLHRLSAQEGLVAIAYERKYGCFSRIYQFAKLYLFHPSSAFYTCPLAMADGAARTLETYGDPSPEKGALSRLTSRNPGLFWTSGQWMTERQGGSDVGETSTVARA